jgi:hypothetical protein
VDYLSETVFKKNVPNAGDMKIVSSSLVSREDNQNINGSNINISPGYGVRLK